MVAHFGVPTRLVARVGASDLESQRRHFLACGVEPLLAGDEFVPTGMVVSIVGSDGERSFLTDRGANARLAAFDLPKAHLACVDSIHLSAYTLAETSSREAVLAFLARAAQLGIPYTSIQTRYACCAQSARKRF